MPIIRQSLQSLQQTIGKIYDSQEAKAISQIVMEFLLQMNCLKLQINHDQALTAPQVQSLEEITHRLLQKEPVQYILEEVDFYGLKLKVNPAVLIPRQETEELVEWIVQAASPSMFSSVFQSQTPRILDIGTGSGCIPLALKKELPAAFVEGVDISETALEVARANAERLQLSIQWQQFDVLNRTIWSLLPKFHFIVSNPPYICEHEKNLLDENVVKYEPAIALFVRDTEPLLFYKTIADLAKLKLEEKGTLFFEVSTHFGEACRDMLLNKGFSQVELRKDMNGNWRMIQAKI